MLACATPFLFRAVFAQELLRASKEIVFISKESQDSIFMARKFNLTVLVEDEWEGFLAFNILVLGLWS